MDEDIWVVRVTAPDGTEHVVHNREEWEALKARYDAETFPLAPGPTCNVCGATGAHEVIRFLRRADGVTRGGYKHMLCAACDEEWDH